jgi:hypothetical protein
MFLRLTASFSNSDITHALGKNPWFCQLNQILQSQPASSGKLEARQMVSVKKNATKLWIQRGGGFIL